MDEAAKPRCPYCGVPMLPAGTLNSRGVDHGQSSTKDHVMPRRYGGKGMIVACCRSCNQRKGSKTPTQWLAYVQEKMPSSR